MLSFIRSFSSSSEFIEGDNADSSPGVILDKKDTKTWLLYKIGFDPACFRRFKHAVLRSSRTSGSKRLKYDVLGNFGGGSPFKCSF